MAESTVVAAGGTEAELREERDFLLRSLVDLDGELAAGDIDQHDYIALKDGYTSRAAGVLRALDHLHGVSPPEETELAAHLQTPAPALTPAESPRRWVRPVVVTGVASFAVVAALLVSNGLGQRLPGATVTGGILAAGPEAQLAQANKDLGSGKYAEALKTYDALLRQDPRNRVALAYRGWILFLTGRQANRPELVDKGLSSIRDAEAADRTYPDAHFFAGMILMHKTDYSGAAAELQKALDTNPPPAFIPAIDGQLKIAQGLAASPPTSVVAPTTR